MKKYIFNISGVTKNYHNHDILNGESWQIPDNLLPEYSSSQELILDITNGDVKIKDDDGEVSARIGLALLQNNSPALFEYYTLTDDDGILVGNGRVLQLHDEFWELESTGEVEDD